MIGLLERVGFALRCSVSILFRAAIPDDIARKLINSDAAQEATIADRTSVSRVKEDRSDSGTFDRAVQMLAILQRDGRLIDFLAENISGYPDAQLGAAVRAIHETCWHSLEKYVKLEPILNSEEDQPATVESGFDPAAIKLIGNVVGEPPLRGLLRHKGWRVKEVNLPPLPQAAGRMVIAPAEVELP